MFLDRFLCKLEFSLLEGDLLAQFGEAIWAARLLSSGPPLLGGGLEGNQEEDLHFGVGGGSPKNKNQLKPPPTPNTLFFRVSCRPSTKKGGIYDGKPGFPKNYPEKKAGTIC